MIDWELFYSQLRTPEFLPGYEIQNRLGGGAFGDVYKARKHSIGKDYAVKFLKVTEGEVVERELDQVSLFAAIDHPNLVTVEDVGVVMGVPFVIMGYAGEDTLSRRMARDDFGRDAYMRIFVQVCRGVLALHDRRLAHFDLKPSNIFLKGEIARVGDYGLSKLIADGKQTLSFGRGTPRYMAPEMLRNRADHRADIYSLGIILYELVAGKLPFDMSEGVFAREEDVPPDFADDFPEELQPVVLRATRFRPEDRYSSVQELLDEMQSTVRRVEDSRIADETVSSGSTILVQDTQSSVEPLPPDETPVPDEYRRAAAELVRGAVGVARGVWDGVRTRSSEALGRGSRAGSAASGELPPEKLGDDVVSFQTLDDPDVYEDGEADSESSASQAESGARSRTSILGMLARERTRRSSHTGATFLSDDDSRDGEESGSQTFSPWNSLPAVGAASVGRTVPVPPAADGGLIGSLGATLVLGFEVMLAILSGPVFYVLRGLGRGLDRAFQPVPGFFGSSLKLVFFLVLLSALGGFVALVAIFVIIS